MYRNFLKNVFDFLTAITAFLVLLPIFLIIIIFIKITMKGPVFFIQTRVGKSMKKFDLYKFRTMKVDAEKVKNGLEVKENDNRVTSFGSLLRKTSLDELPQLFNVIKGDISLVGPRPCLPEQLPYFSKSQNKRFNVKPGITGLAIVNGRSKIPWSKRIDFDLKYIHTLSFLTDIKIIIKTIYVIFTFKNVYYNIPNQHAFDLTDPDNLPQSSKIKDKNNNDN